MKVIGDHNGIEALRQLVADHREYLKFLVAEAGSNTDHRAPFRGPDGVLWHLVHHPLSGELEVRRAES